MCISLQGKTHEHRSCQSSPSQITTSIILKNLPHPKTAPTLSGIKPHHIQHNATQPRLRPKGRYESNIPELQEKASQKQNHRVIGSPRNKERLEEESSVKKVTGSITPTPRSVISHHRHGYDLITNNNISRKVHR
jgi:hypothetical protein